MLTLGNIYVKMRIIISCIHKICEILYSSRDGHANFVYNFFSGKKKSGCGGKTSELFLLTYDSEADESIVKAAVGS